MKRLSLLVIFFYLCTFCQPPQVKAAVPLALVAAGALGAALVSTSAGTYYQQNGKAPEWVSATSNAAASAADAIFQPSYLAQAVGYLFSPSSLATAQEYYAAKAAAVGAKIGDIVDFVNNSASSLYSSLRSLIDSIKGDPTFATEPSANSNIQTPSGVNLAISGNWGWAHDYTYDIIPDWKNMYEYLGMYNGAWYFWNKKSNGDIYKITDEPGFNGYAHYMRVFWCSCWPASSGNPASGGKPNYDALKSALANPNSGVINDTRDVIKALPASQQIVAGATPNTVDTKAPAPSITPNEIKQILAQNAADVAQAVANQLAAQAAADTSNTALQIAAAQAAANAAKAAADAAEIADTPEETPEETFTQLNPSAFGTAYNPGEFNIPARFTSFLQNVKSSGLFSFSSSFFNSLPGGGSPLLTVNGGQTFGTHTFDFSQSLGGGLAILKSVLLALFGFLSVRAVIMKR